MAHTFDMVGLRRGAAGAGLVGTGVSFVPPIIAVYGEGWTSAPLLALQLLTAAAALVLLLIPDHRPDGWWMAGATAMIGIGAIDQPAFESGYWIEFVFTLKYAAGACLVVPFLRFPEHPASPRSVRRLSLAAWIALVGVMVAAAPLWSPSMNGYEGPIRWLTLVRWEAAARILPDAVPWLFLPVVVGFTVVQWRRQRTAGGPNGRVIRLLAWLTILMAWGYLVRIFLEVSVAAWEVQNVLRVVHITFTAAAVMAILLVAIGVTLHRATFLDDLLATAGQAPALEAVLRRHTADPTLQLRFLTDDGWTDANGHPVGGHPASADRSLHPVVVEEGRPVVEAELDGRLDPRHRSVGSLLDAAGVVLTQARLSVQQAAQSVELRESRARIVESGVRQRRQLERDLHDGAQQHLLAAQAALSRAGLLHEPGEVNQALEEVHARLTSTMAELRGLARGLHPALLSQAGLGAALDSLAGLSDRVSVHVAPDLSGRRFVPVVEATAWFVASETVVNALKHADGAVQVQARLEGELLVCEVTDQGQGGAVIVPGGGLAGLHDRVRAAGGSFHVASSPETGTQVTARLPARPVGPQ
ncbi:MAG: sensor histidine kinase [Propionibacteriaceae bacterium]